MDLQKGKYNSESTSSKDSTYLLLGKAPDTSREFPLRAREVRIELLFC